MGRSDSGSEQRRSRSEVTSPEESGSNCKRGGDARAVKRASGGTRSDRAGTSNKSENILEYMSE